MEDLNKNAFQILKTLLKSEKIVDLLEGSDLEDASDLMYKSLFPSTHIPGVDDTAKSYVTMSYRDLRKSNNSNIMGYVKIVIICHKSKMHIDEGSRLLSLVEQVDEILDQQKIGLGKLLFKTGDETPINANHYGFYLLYEIWHDVKGNRARR